MTFGGIAIPTIDQRGNPVFEAVLVRGGGLTFRIPINVGAATGAWVEVWDGKRLLRRDKLGTLPHTTP